MTPELKRDFEAEWPALERRLKLVLCHKRVPLAHQEDLLQEVALRLVRTWTTVDKERTWVFTKTILLNLLRDEYRRRTTRPEDLYELPDLPSRNNIEASGIARLELQRVRKALDGLSEAHRAVLLAEVGEHSLESAETGAATKMMRMRARRKLTAAVEKISAVVILRSKKAWEIVHGLTALRDEAVPALGCILCIVLGAGSALTVAVPAPANAGGIPKEGRVVSSTVAATSEISDRSDWATELPSRGEHLSANSDPGTQDQSKKDKKKPQPKKKNVDHGSGDTDPALVKVPEHVPGTSVYIGPGTVGIQVAPEGGKGGEDPREQVPGTSLTVETVAAVNPSEILQEETLEEQVQVSL